MRGESGPTTRPGDDPVATAESDPSLRVHLLAGLPTESVRSGFARAADALRVVPLDALADIEVGDATRLGVLLPPFAEPSLIVESWQECDFLPFRFGRPAHVAGVSTFLDVDRVGDQLGSGAALSLHGWGRCDLDGRTVADILVGQIESATHLVLVGETPPCDAVARCLGVLNPGAACIPLSTGSQLDGTGLARALGWEPCDGRKSSAERPPRVVPPWLDVLHGDADPGSDLIVYHRAHPFDPIRFSEWLADPPRELVRGKGHVWLASEPEQSFGYSCAGSVHRVFPAGRWWASYGGSAWPSCAAQRRRLLERWHPRFGDRRQELVLAGVDLDRDRLCADLDACLLPEAEVGCSSEAPPAEGAAQPSVPRGRLH